MNSNTKLSWSNVEENIDDIIDLLIQDFKELNDEDFVVNLKFVDLQKMVESLPDFINDNSCNERKLEAIQQRLIEESE